MSSKPKENETQTAENDSVDLSAVQNIVEALLMASDIPLSIDRLQQLLAQLAPHQPTADDVKTVLDAIAESTEGRAFVLKEVSSGWRFQVRSDYSQWVQKLWEERPPRYSRALLEILAIIAYRQPITRPEIEQIRGVAVSTSIIKTLSEREWVHVVGHRDVPGTPALYATTKQFLNYFGLKRLEELPELPEFEGTEAVEKKLEHLEEMNISQLVTTPSPQPQASPVEVE